MNSAFFISYVHDLCGNEANPRTECCCAFVTLIPFKLFAAVTGMSLSLPRRLRNIVYRHKAKTNSYTAIIAPYFHGIFLSVEK